MSKSSLKRLAVMIVSGLIIGFGVYLAVMANVGADALTTFQQGLSRTLGLELALCNFLANAFFTLLIFIADRKALKLPDIIYPFIISSGIKLSGYIVLPVSSMFLRVVYFILALIIIGLGIGLGVNSKCGNNPYDGLVLLISKRVNKQFKHVRMLMDLTVLVIGIVLGGSFGIGTFVSMLSQGTIGQFFIEMLRKNRFLNKFTA
ncbi:MAG TPA: hypothetical protein PK631_04250 [Erysipelotrichaceae bacterium]|nr:hypothetical protein [Erysipelotrichaceae bacterium]